jgi:pimeloyl-[acyl-carrier protein] methyl ester esterase
MMRDLVTHTRGQGPDLVMLHGWGMHAGVFDGLAVMLAGRFTVHAVDLPGHGGSAMGSLGEVHETLARMFPRPAAVLGWSLGGQIAMQWAAVRNNGIGRLVLVGATPKFVRDDGWETGMKLDLLMQLAQDMRENFDVSLSRFLALQVRGMKDGVSVLRNLRESFFSRPSPSPMTLEGGLDCLLHNDLRSLVSSLDVPALIIQGAQDTLTHPGAARWLHEQMPNACLMWLERAGHAPFISHPDEIAAGIVGFCEMENV